MSEADQLILRMCRVVREEKKSPSRHRECALKAANKFVASLSDDQVMAIARRFGSQIATPGDYREVLTDHIYDEILGYD